MSQRSAYTATIALAATLAIQVFTSLASTATAVLAPEIARDFGLPAKLVGGFIGLLYVGSMTASLASGHFIARRRVLAIAGAGDRVASRAADGSRLRGGHRSAGSIHAAATRCRQRGAPFLDRGLVGASADGRTAPLRSSSFRSWASYTPRCKCV
jgi:hypothetical protein